ncbi:MAG: protein-disulfide reductase DsbD [Methylotenera sp.]|nr:protein-disulfide reductase DsbD [Methylotenera sp.]MDP1755346.1 protein-disulfide reductase DsbD [Methylotenera sp.]MDP1959443.1 protein-disulfide reductase DsbD [Methylotenera sp.]MDP3206286.1 protein-disulfide reductase DsbD [Methylotenera sp.]MDP3303410.1 protein-disulfide reductase DsbD [Methylotenera sp.]
MLKRIFYCLLLTCIALSAPASIAGNAGNTLKGLFTNNATEDEFLSPDVAFGLDIRQSSHQILANFTVAPGYYLYKERIKFVLTPAIQHEISLPAGDIKNDPNFGEMEVYHQDFTGVITVKGVQNAAITVKATYQGCSEKGLCYAPQHKTFTIVPNNTSNNNNNAETAAPTASVTQSTNNSLSSDSKAADLLKSGKWWLIILGFFGAGLLLAFTPCVFPMIPILSSIIIGKNAHVTRLHAFNLSLAYTLGMCLTYTLAGIAAGLSGQMLSSALQTPWALGFGASIFALLALSMFGFYELKLPSSLENSLFNLSHRIKGGRFFSDFLMGILSALIISPCVAAPLAGALLYISSTNDVVLGGVALFSLSLGMGTPLLLIGASAGTLLPKVGNWMNAVRNVFGVLMLGVAVWLIAPIIPVSVQMALWAALLIVPAIFMHALDNLPVDAKPALKFWKGIAIMLLVAGLAVLIGALSNAKSPLEPLGGLLAKTNSTHQQSALQFNRVRSLTDLESQLLAAKGKPVMLDFYADWCVSCKELEQFTFSDSRVQSALKDTVLLQVDVTENNDDDKALLKKFSLFGPPGILFFNAKSEHESNLKVVGYQNADDFLLTLNQRGSCLPETIEC